MNTPHAPNPTNEPTASPDPLERRLAALTDWREGTQPTLHAEALRRVRAGNAESPAPADAHAQSSGVAGRVWWRRPAVAVPAAAALFMMVVAAAIFTSGARTSHRAGGPAALVESDRAVPATSAPATYGGFAEVHKSAADDHADQAAPDAQPADRAVIRKASIEITSKGVRADFARAALLVSEARGEFVEASALNGEGADTQGTLTLRVTSERLSDVLNELRALGVVASEKSSGDDVTEQVVDLGARLRNEQKVEEELLKLMESRRGAPLKEVLDLREQVAKVRERIEQMTAQQERLGRSVSLATILVILRPERPADAEAEHTKHESALDYFGERMENAWHAGTRALADSAAAFVRAAVGGLMWWTLLAAAIVACLRAVREARRRGSREPAPAM